HREYLGQELAQSRRWGADVREAPRTELSYYQPSGGEYTLWCPEDVYIEEPARLIEGWLAARRGERGGGGRERAGHRDTGHRRPRRRCRDRTPVDRRAGGRGRGGRLGPAGGRPGRGPGTGRSGPPSAADHRARERRRPGRRD